MAYSDDEILEAIQGADVNRHNQALKQLYMDPVVNTKVAALLAQYGKVHLDADEVIQEGIILLNDLIRNGQFQSRSKVRTFLIGICKNIIRSGSKKIEQLSFANSPTEMPEGEQRAESTEEQLILEEAGGAAQQRDLLLRELLTQLTENCREVLHMYYFLSQSMAQIAEARELKNAKQAKKAANRCREQLRGKIQAQPYLANLLNVSL